MTAKRLAWSCAIAGAYMWAIGAPARAQGTGCDSPCKVFHLPLITQKERPVALTDPIFDLMLQLYKPYMFYQVDSVAKLLSGSRLPYPDQFGDSRINGEVIATVVVDSLGHVVPASMQVVYATNPVFIQAVRSELSKMRFAPAKLAGRPVAQIVRQNFDFIPPRP